MEPVSNETSETIQEKEVDEPSKFDKNSEQQNAQTDATDTSEPAEKSAPAVDSDKSIDEINSSVSENAMEIVESPEVSRSENENENTSADVSMEVDQDETSDNVSKADNTDKDTAESTKDDDKAKELVDEKDDDIDNDKEVTSDEQKICANVEVLDKTENDSETNEKDSDDTVEPASNKIVEESNESEKDSSGKEKDSSACNDTKKSSDDESQPAEEDSTKNSSEAPPSEQALECDDVIMECENGKEASNGKSEVENTEFVQFSNQDKDDSQLENQPDAEDPFGGDNLANNTDNGEAMEVDSSSNDKNSKTVEEDDSSKEAECSKEKDKDVTSIDKPKEEDSKSKKDPTDKETKSTTKKPSTDSSEQKDESSTAEILPGQDDELCIIPDSTKGNKDNRKEKENDTQSTEEEKEEEKEGETEKETETEKEKDIVIEEEEIVIENKTSDDSDKDKETTAPQTAEADTKKSGLKVAAISSGTNDIQVNVEKSADGSTIVTSDIIDIEDDAKNPEIEEIASKEVCKQCKQEKTCNIKVKVGTKTFNVCSDECKTAFSTDNNKATDIPSEGVNSKRDKRCASCLLIVESKDERNLSWETMEFCNEECLGKFQTKYGSYCRNCNGAVQPVSLGKYCVRFGYDVRQFCCSTCLEEFKKGLKVCSYCQKDISAGTEGFLAPVGDKGQFKDFCTQDCMEKYSKMNSTEPPPPEERICGVCQEKKVMHCEVQIDRNPSVPICSEPCFAAFKFVNKVDPDQCSTCKKYFQLPTKTGFVVFYEDEAHTFCNKTCLNVFIITNRKIVPCNWCKVKKYNFDMIKKELKSGQVMMMCSLNCLTLYQVSINAVSARRINCDFCKEFSQAQYHLTMSDATIRNFCSYKCVMNFQAQYTKSPITIPSGETNATTATTTPSGPAGLTPIGAGDPVPTGIPKRAVVPTAPTAPVRPIQPAPAPDQLAQKKSLPVISSVTSLAALANGQSQNTVQLANTTQPSIGSTLQPITLQGTAPVIYKQQVVTRPTSPIDMANKMTQCKPHMHTKGVSVRPVPCTQSTQTEGIHPVIVPIPVPIYVPFPVHMYSMPFPVPVPIPIPIPVPIFIPTTRNSHKGIMKELKRIQEKTPADPFEAELLMMAEMVATEKKTESDSDSNDEVPEDADADAETEVNDSAPTDSYSPEGENAFGEDMLQMALKIATGELDEPAVDLDTALTPSTIQVPQKQNDEGNENQAPTVKPHTPRGRKRSASQRGRGGAKRGRRSANSNVTLLQPADGDAANQQSFVKPVERPDANMALKYTFGVNAWRQWVITKNAELEKQSTPTRKLKLFKTDLLQLTADELNYSLCLFVKEVRKPNGAEYEPDTIYYLCLGIQQYLFENNRIDNIFTDAYYEKFTDCLNEVAKKFTTLYSNALYVVTRVEEEHLWECKQLGAHSPHVLLNTLMYFNTKHFNLVTVDEHMQLSFSHIMKHWKRNPAAQPSAVAGKAPGSRNVLLRFYPPQAALEANSKKKKVYEQQENEENPLRCPVKLYEFYLSKCPESVKTRNDVFYLLPERSCVPDSPVWYSTSPLAKEHLIKMLHRIKMVKEINVALLTS